MSSQLQSLSEAYQEVQEMDLKKGLKGFTDMLGKAGSAVVKGAQSVGGAARNVEKARTGNKDKNKDKDKETDEQRAARRAKVGLSGNADANRAKESQAAIKAKVDKVNADRKAGKTSSLPSDYKKTEAQQFEKADKFRKGAGTSSLPTSVQKEVKKAAAPTPAAKPQPKPLDTSKVTSPTPNFNRSAKPSVTPKPSGGGMKRRPTGRAEMRSANIARTNSRRSSRPSTPKPMADTSRIDSATSGVGKFTEEF